MGWNGLKLLQIFDLVEFSAGICFHVSSRQPWMLLTVNAYSQQHDVDSPNHHPALTPTKSRPLLTHLEQEMQEYSQHSPLGFSWFSSISSLSSWHAHPTTAMLPRARPIFGTSDVWKIQTFHVRVLRQFEEFVDITAGKQIMLHKPFTSMNVFATGPLMPLAFPCECASILLPMFLSTLPCVPGWNSHFLVTVTYNMAWTTVPPFHLQLKVFSHSRPPWNDPSVIMNQKVLKTEM